MKKSFFSVTFLVVSSFIFIFGKTVAAKEEPIPATLPQALLKEGKTSQLDPFRFSLLEGKWLESRTGAVFTTGNDLIDFILPSLKEEPAPIRYPRWAVREGWQGEFVIAIEVLPTGEVGRYQVMKSTTHPLLDVAAIEAVKTWRFTPALEKGKAIVSCIQIPILFELQEDRR